MAPVAYRRLRLTSWALVRSALVVAVVRGAVGLVTVGALVGTRVGRVAVGAAEVGAEVGGEEGRVLVVTGWDGPTDGCAGDAPGGV
jgi:hypothetical protein